MKTKRVKITKKQRAIIKAAIDSIPYRDAPLMKILSANRKEAMSEEKPTAEQIAEKVFRDCWVEPPYRGQFNLKPLIDLITQERLAGEKKDERIKWLEATYFNSQENLRIVEDRYKAQIAALEKKVLEETTKWSEAYGIKASKVIELEKKLDEGRKALAYIQSILPAGPDEMQHRIESCQNEFFHLICVDIPALVDEALRKTKEGS